MIGQTNRQTEITTLYLYMLKIIYLYCKHEQLSVTHEKVKVRKS